MNTDHTLISLGIGGDSLTEIEETTGRTSIQGEYMYASMLVSSEIEEKEEFVDEEVILSSHIIF